MTTSLPASAIAIEELDALGDFVGHTPLRALPSLSPSPEVQLLAKLEWQQLGGSIDARPAYHLLREAVLAGQLSPERGLLLTAPGPGVLAYASMCARLGIPLTVSAGRELPPERQLALQALGVEVQRVEGGVAEAALQAQALAAAQPGRYFLAASAGREANWKAHYYHTAREIYHQTQGGLTHFVAEANEAFIGTGRKLKEVNPAIQLVGHGDPQGPGIAGPVADAIATVTPEQVASMAQTAARRAGLLVSPAGAANLAAAVAVAATLESGVVVTLLPEEGYRHLDWLHRLGENA